MKKSFFSFLLLFFAVLIAAPPATAAVDLVDPETVQTIEAEQTVNIEAEFTADYKSAGTPYSVINQFETEAEGAEHYNALRPGFLDASLE